MRLFDKIYFTLAALVIAYRQLPLFDKIYFPLAALTIAYLFYRHAILGIPVPPMGIE